MNDSILISIFISFPEAILVFLLGFSFTNIKIDIKKIFIMALVQALIAYLIKVLDIPFGEHTLMQLITLWALVVIFQKVKYYKAVVPVLIGVFMQGFLQIAILSSFGLFVKVDIQQLNSDFMYTFLFSLPLFLIQILIFLILKKTNFIFCDLSPEGELIGKPE